MEVDKSIDSQLHSCRRDLVKPMSLVMDDHGALPHPPSSALRVSTKSKAPSPPGLKKLDSPGLSQWYPGNPHLTMDQKENLIDEDLCLAVVLPGGEEKMTTVPGSKPLMDLLVTLCAKYHLNPSSYTLELVTTNRKKTKLKPNALIGTLDAEKVILKPKGEDKNKKPGPQMPEATVRMVINYRKTQKTILRVNPRVPLAEHLPAICEKCEFDVESTVLLRDVHSVAPLDLSYSLNDYAIREVYARDTKRQPMTPVSPVSPSHAGAVMPGKDKNQKEEENKGLFSKFRKSKKKSDQAMTVSAPASPVLASKPRPLSMALPSSNSSLLGSHTVLTDVPKKRRAPQPPVLVSQGCSSDLVTRRRINSESNAQLDSDQTAGLSRGSSAENSLKRTKRKAPPPPPSPSTAVPETIPVEENLQGGAAANTLEEITEQEESTALPMFATASDPRGEDNVFSMPTEVSQESPSPDTDTPSTRSVMSCGEDQSCDLSSDGNQPPSTMNESIAPSEDRIPEGTGTSEPAEASDGPCQFENVSQPITSEESTPVSVKGDCSTILPPPVIEDAETHCSVQGNTETVQEQTDGLVNPAATSVSCPSNEDDQVQTDITPLPVPPEELMENDPSSANVPVFESAEQKDMATSTGEQDSPELKGALSHTSETSSCQDSTPSAPAAKEAAAIYATTSEPKPKPSNELTRDYIPKVGMTTYTIVPQKSLEKLRYFEVALTLEQSLAAEEEGPSMGLLHLEESTTPGEQTAVSEEKSELHSTVPREHLLTSITTATTQDSVNGTIPGSISSSSATSFPKADGASQAGSAARVKEVKIPPATKPKPGSFRLAQHKKKPGYYVTSAAEKSVSAQRAAPASGERAPPSPPLPPPPPPVLCHEDTTGASNVELNPKADDKNATVMRITRQSSLPSKQPNFGLSLEKLRSFVGPRPYSPATPSRFAQAVSSAVKRSQSLSHHTPKSPSPPDSAPLSPVTSHASAMDSKGLSKLQDSTEMDGDKSATLVGGCKGPSLSGIVLMEGESSP